jgi:predicted RNA-binding Zn ribbon-like protein
MASTPSRTEWTFDLSGGRLCLDFANTVSGMRDVAPKEHLARYEDLVAFARQTGVVDDAHAHRLLAEAALHPSDARATFDRAIELREALYRIFLARARAAPPAAADLERLNAELARALSRRRIVARGDRLALGWDDAVALDAPLWPIADSAATLLSSDARADRIRVCGLFDTEECSWLFVDETRAGTRRWCSMDDCGNKAKARRHYRRAKEGDPG